MRVQSISTYYKQGSIVKKANQVSKENNVQPSFKSAGKVVKGALVGGGAAALLGLLTPFGWAILPLWSVAGAIAGHVVDEQSSDGETSSEG